MQKRDYSCKITVGAQCQSGADSQKQIGADVAERMWRR